MYLPDPIEAGESRAERAFAELEQPGGLMKCYQCDAIFDPQECGGTLSPDPYAMPVCGKCFEAAMVEWEKAKQEVNGTEEIRDGKTYWMGTLVEPCTMCGLAVTCVDDCGCFGNAMCPRFGILGTKLAKAVVPYVAPAIEADEIILPGCTSAKVEIPEDWEVLTEEKLRRLRDRFKK